MHWWWHLYHTNMHHTKKKKKNVKYANVEVFSQFWIALLKLYFVSVSSISTVTAIPITNVLGIQVLKSRLINRTICTKHLKWNDVGAGICWPYGKRKKLHRDHIIRSYILSVLDLCCMYFLKENNSGYRHHTCSGNHSSCLTIMCRNVFIHAALIFPANQYETGAE